MGEELKYTLQKAGATIDSILNTIYKFINGTEPLTGGSISVTGDVSVGGSHFLTQKANQKDLNTLSANVTNLSNTKANQSDVNTLSANVTELTTTVGTKATIVDISQYVDSSGAHYGEKLPLNAVYVWAGNPTHGIRLNGNDTTCLAFCIYHDDDDNEDSHNCTVYYFTDENGGTDYYYAGDFNTSDPQNSLQSEIAVAFGDVLATHQRKGLMSKEDKKKVDSLVAYIDNESSAFDMYNALEDQFKLFWSGNNLPTDGSYLAELPIIYKDGTNPITGLQKVYQTTTQYLSGVARKTGTVFYVSVFAPIKGAQFVVYKASNVVYRILNFRIYDTLAFYNNRGGATASSAGLMTSTLYNKLSDLPSQVYSKTEVDEKVASMSLEPVIIEGTASDDNTLLPPASEADPKRIYIVIRTDSTTLAVTKNQYLATKTADWTLIGSAHGVGNGLDGDSSSCNVGGLLIDLENNKLLRCISGGMYEFLEFEEVEVSNGDAYYVANSSSDYNNKLYAFLNNAWELQGNKDMTEPTYTYSWKNIGSTDITAVTKVEIPKASGESASLPSMGYIFVWNNNVAEYRKMSWDDESDHYMMAFVARWYPTESGTDLGKIYRAIVCDYDPSGNSISFYADYSSPNIPDSILSLFNEKEATTLRSGLMSANDKAKLDSLPTNAYSQEATRQLLYPIEVDTLPSASSAEMGRMYLIPNANHETGNTREEWIIATKPYILYNGTKYYFTNKGTARGWWESTDYAEGSEGDILLHTNPKTDIIEICTQASGDDEHGDWQPAEWEAGDCDYGDTYYINNVAYIWTPSGWIERDSPSDWQMHSQTHSSEQVWERVGDALGEAKAQLSKLVEIINPDTPLVQQLVANTVWDNDIWTSSDNLFTTEKTTGSEFTYYAADRFKIRNATVKLSSACIITSISFKVKPDSGATETNITLGGRTYNITSETIKTITLNSTETTIIVDNHYTSITITVNYHQDNLSKEIERAKAAEKALTVTEEQFLQIYKFD